MQETWAVEDDPNREFAKGGKSPGLSLNNPKVKGAHFIINWIHVVYKRHGKRDSEP